MRKMFYEDLPQKEGMGALKGKQVIDWVGSKGRKVKFVYEDITDEVEIVDYNVENKKLYIKYLNKNRFEINLDSFKGCQLGKLLGKITSEFKLEIGQILKDEKRDITIIDRKYKRKINKNGWTENQKYYKYKCNKCGFECGEHYRKGEYQEDLWILESGLLNGNGCFHCSNQIVVKGINDILTTTPWMAKYFQNPDDAKKYAKSSNQKIIATCPDCGRIKNKKISICDIYNDHSVGCGCGDGKSYPEKIMFNVLEQLNINFETEYNPDWIKPKRYDFYFELNNKKYIIETDGGWHKEDNKMSGKTKEESKFIDNEKDRLAYEHDIKVIRIDSKESELEYIKNNILKSKLNELFELSRVNWICCEEFALSNLCKKCCELKRDNPDITTIEIGDIMNLNYTTITRYLKKGTKLGWCDYDPKEEMKKSGKLHGKPVEIFKDGISLGKFENCHELERQSDEKFGVKLLSSAISSVCLGRQKHSKGFVFKYIYKK